MANAARVGLDEELAEHRAPTSGTRPSMRPFTPGAPHTSFERVRVDDVPFDVVTMEQAVERVIAMAQAVDRPRYVCTGNLDHLVLISRDAEFRAVYENSDLNVADGMPLVWLSRVAGGTPLPERVAGIDLFWELVRASFAHGLRLYFLGGAPASAAKAAQLIQERFPEAHVVGTYCPPFERFDTEEEQARIRERIRAAEPDVLLVGLGAPKQEKWIAKNATAIGVPVSIGVGGSFEMAAGVRKRAPRWIQRQGMEWLYRFAQEPSRLFDRYFRDDLPHLLRLVARTLRARSGRSVGSRVTKC